MYIDKAFAEYGKCLVRYKREIIEMVDVIENRDMPCRVIVAHSAESGERLFIPPWAEVEVIDNGRKVP